MCCTRLAENTGRKKVAKNRHLGTIAQLCWAISSQLRHISTIVKKLVKQQYVLQMSPQYGELRPTSGWDHLVSLWNPTKFQLVSRLGSVTARHVVVGVSHTLRRWIEGATYVRQVSHHVGHWPTFLVSILFNNNNRICLWSSSCAWVCWTSLRCCIPSISDFSFSESYSPISRGLLPPVNLAEFHSQ